MVEAVDDVRDVVVGHLGALVVQAEAVGLHIVEPHVFRAARAGLGEYQHRRGYPRVGLEHAGGHGNHRPQLVALHQFPADSLVGLGGAEQHAVGDDACALSALFQHAQKQRQEQQLSLFGVGDGFQVVADALGVHGALEGRVGQAHGKAVADVVLFGNAVLVVDFRVGDGMEHQVHGGDAQHGAVHVKAGEGVPGEVFPLLRGHAVLVMVADVLRRPHQEARRAAGGVADGVLRGGPEQLHHHGNDMPGRAELAVLSGGGQLAQHVLVQVALHVLLGKIVLVEVVQPGDDLLQHLGRGNQEHGVAHVAGKGGILLGIILDGLSIPGGRVRPDRLALFVDFRQAAMAHIFDGREHPLGNRLVNVPGIVMLEFAPAHALPQGRGRENLVHFLAGHVFKFFGFQLFLVQGADKHQIGELLDHRQGIGDAARPDVRPDFVYFIFNRTGYHARTPPPEPLSHF